MKRFSLAAMAAMLLVPGAYAADVNRPAAVKAAAAAAVPIDPWTGFFIGPNLGYGFNLSGVTANANVGGVPVFTGGQLMNAPQGFTGGLQMGYNFRLLPGNFTLAGIEAEINAGNFSGSSNIPGLLSSSAQLNWYGSLVGKFGFTIFPNWWLYAAGGLAFGDPTNTFTIDGCTGAGCAGSFGNTRTGGAYGLGSEFLLDPSGHWKIGFDWRRYQFGTPTDSLTPGGGPLTVTFTPTNTFDVFRGRLNYYF